MRVPPRAAGALAALAALALAAVGCGDTLQDQPIASGSLEQLIMVRAFPIYWLGTRFEGLALASVTEDPSGAYMIQYGNCSIGGQYTCVSPLALITTPDNSFLPGGSSPSRRVLIRGVQGAATRRGAALELPTGGVLVDIYAKTPALARSAAAIMIPINRLAVPGAPLPAPVPNTRFDERPLLDQMPTAAVPLPAPAASASAAGAGVARR
jgi:hypothetical protein